MNDLTSGNCIIFDYEFENDDQKHDWIGKIIHLESKRIYLRASSMNGYIITASFDFDRMSNIQIIDETQYRLMLA
jgi:hypothetical protein